MDVKQITRIVSILAALAISPPLQAQGNLTELSATEAAKLIRAGKLRSEDLVKALCDQIENKKDLGAFISFDREAALKAARAADADAAKGKFKGPLHGVPLVVKDNIHVAGFPNTAGTLALKDFRPKSHAPIVAKLIGAGAIVLGKTTCTNSRSVSPTITVFSARRAIPTIPNASRVAPPVELEWRSPLGWRRRGWARIQEA